jgi:hypothetical protein
LRHSISCLSITGESAGIDKNLIRRSEGRSWSYEEFWH